MAAQKEADILGRSVWSSAVIHFHEERQILLDSLQLVLRFATHGDLNQGVRGIFQEAVNQILKSKDNSSSNASTFTKKCLGDMKNIRKWLQDIADKLQGAIVSGSTNMPGFLETMEYQRNSLLRQHESLGTCLSYLVKSKHPDPGDFEEISAILSTFDKYDSILVHYTPFLLSLISHFGSSEGGASIEEARKFNQKLVLSREAHPWPLRYFQAAIMTWWLSEYSGWYADDQGGSPLHGINLDDEAAERSELFKKALADGAFDFTMTLSIDVKSQDWYDPIRHGLRQRLQTKAPSLPFDSIPFSQYLQAAVLEGIETFVDAFITNMPDSLRQLRIDEDEQRRLTQASEYGHDLEKFLVIVSYAFEHRPESSQSFWTDSDSNLFGFLQWAGKRPSTPRATALCEVLIAIGEGAENADAVHLFLLEDGQSALGKLRRTNSVNWGHILLELQFYSTKVQDRVPPTQTNGYDSIGQRRKARDPEDEISTLYQSYLRLIAHLCRESSIAKGWLLLQSGVSIVDLCFSLCGPGASTRVRATAFGVLSALVQQKTIESGESMWLSLDHWLSGGFSNALVPQASSQAPHTPVWAGDTILETVVSGFEEPDAFVRLLQALLRPFPEEVGLNDMLPFPESLGSANRMSGIEPYIDVVMGRIFGMKVQEIQDKLQQRTLRLSCLDYIMTCLSTFNEDLVIFANQSSIPVDSTIRTSSLAIYIRLHPFARVMEWLFNDKALASLFEAAHQDVTEVNDALPDSPLVLGLIRSIEVMTTVLRLQSTYLDIVRPEIKIKSSNRPISVANPSLAFFEDAFANHLNVLVDLGLYCATGHAQLNLAALVLLEILSSSRKLIPAPVGMFGQRHDRNKLIGVLEANGESDRIARSLVDQLRVDARELEQGPDSPRYAIKMGIVSFIKSCLLSTPNRPNISHLLLGFSCQGTSLDVNSSGSFARSISLFHSLAQLATDLPQIEDGNFLPWLVHLKTSAIQILQILWKAPLSSIYTMTELRANEYLFVQFVDQVVVDHDTLWDGLSILQDRFYNTHSAECLGNFLHQRSALYDYAASELRLIIQQGAPSLKDRIVSTLLGSTITPDGESIFNPTLFDLFDFAELEITEASETPSLGSYASLDVNICIKEDPDGLPLYDLPSVQEMIALHQVKYSRQGTITTPEAEQQFLREGHDLVLFLHSNNQRRSLLLDRLDTLASWARLVLVVLDGSDFDASIKSSFVLQTLQVIIPKLERYCQENIAEALILAYLARSLFSSLDLSQPAFGQSRVGDAGNDRLFQLFKVALRAINFPSATTALRHVMYHICLQYLDGLSVSEAPNDPRRRHAMRTIKSIGQRLVEVICDDAYGSEEECRVSALLLLDSFVFVANIEQSSFLVDSLVRLNFVGILVDSIKNIPNELRETPAQGDYHYCIIDLPANSIQM
jgi:nuclear pore complex protein Nup205